MREKKSIFFRIGRCFWKPASNKKTKTKGAPLAGGSSGTWAPHGRAGAPAARPRPEPAPAAGAGAAAGCAGPPGGSDGNAPLGAPRSKTRTKCAKNWGLCCGVCFVSFWGNKRPWWMSKPCKPGPCHSLPKQPRRTPMFATVYPREPPEPLPSPMVFQ